MGEQQQSAGRPEHAEPGEEELRHRQGTFIRKPRRGLHHLEIFATAEQFETLATAMNTATNPRLQHDDAGTGTGPDLARRLSEAARG